MRDLPDGDPASVVRRAPFSDNPLVGARGQKARQRILAAALEVFGEVGYHSTGIVRITEVAGCSRASFYQYFSSKEDVFRHLAGHVARELTASAEALDPVTADAAGRRSLLDWVERHAAIYATYQPVFEAFQAAAESDDAIASGSARIANEQVAIVRAKVQSSTLPPRRIAGVIDLLLNVTTRTAHIGGVLVTALPSGALPPTRVRGALADLAHRSLFGVDPDVNARPGARRPVPRVRHATTLLRGLSTETTAPPDLTPTGARTLAAILDGAHEVLVTRGYHGTRIDDVTGAADVSHGAFYRYFDNKDQLVRVLALRAMSRIGAAFNEFPDVDAVRAPGGGKVLRRWLARYASVYAAETAMVRVWVDATAGDPIGSLESAAAVDWGRSRLLRSLRGRGFDGDLDVDALLLVTLLEAFGADPRSSSIVEPTALLVERALLGLS